MTDEEFAEVLETADEFMRLCREHPPGSAERAAVEPRVLEMRARLDALSPALPGPQAVELRNRFLSAADPDADKLRWVGHGAVREAA